MHKTHTLKVISNFLVSIACLLQPFSPSHASESLKVTVRRIVGANVLTVDGSLGSKGDIVGTGQSLQTHSSRADVVFGNRAIGLVNAETEISIAQDCFVLVKGSILVNGTQSPCLGTNRLGISGTTYVISKQEDQTYSVAVLSGSITLGSDLQQTDVKEINILDTYPRILPSLGAKGSGFGDAFPGGSSAGIIGLSYFTPLAQAKSSKILYSYTSAGYSTNDIWGVGTELGFRQFNPANQAISSVYLGYSGYQGQSCFSNFANAGMQWERARWRIGASGGFRANDCPTGFSFAALNLAAPIASHKHLPVYLSLSPYFLFGNVTNPLDVIDGGDNNSSSFPGGRLTLEYPLTPALSIRLHGSVDTVFGIQAGGTISYRIPTSGSFLKDKYVTVHGLPTRPLQTAPLSPEIPGVSSDLIKGWLPTASKAVQSDMPLIAMGSTNQLPSAFLSVSQTPSADSSSSSIVLKEGNKATLNPDGSVVKVEAISNIEYVSLLKNNLRGQDLIPESHRLGLIAEARGVLDRGLASILGFDMTRNSTTAISETVDTPFSPTSIMPVARYICAATDEAKERGRIEASGSQFDYDGRDVFLGRGSEASQGFPATYNRSDAYIFSSPDTCNRINDELGEGYRVLRPVLFRN